jgi:hypothetical protein
VKRLFPFFILMALISSCEPTPESDKGAVLAKAHGNYLYESDLIDVIPAGTSARDSLLLTKNFIDNWIKNRLLIHQAERNLTPKQLDFSKELDEYRNSLIIFAYESELIKQNLDTLVEDAEIEKYYVENISNFSLKYNIVRAIYVGLPYQADEISYFRELMNNPDTLMLDSLDIYARQYAISYQLNDETWLRFDQLLNLIPIETYNQELFLKTNSYIEIEDDPVTYLLLIRDFMVSESLSPLQLVRDNIKNIILNKRKRLLISEMKNNLIEQATRDHVFEIY